MSTISPPIRCSGGRIARRAVGRAAFGFLGGPLFIIAMSASNLAAMWVFALLGAALLLLMIPFVGIAVWTNCRWLEFDGLTLRGQRFRPFRSFDCPVEDIKRIAAQMPAMATNPMRTAFILARQAYR